MIVTIGWDIGVLKKEDEGKKTNTKYDLVVDCKDGQKTEYDEVNVKRMLVSRWFSDMSYEDTKRVIDSTEDLPYVNLWSVLLVLNSIYVQR